MSSFLQIQAAIMTRRHISSIYSEIMFYKKIDTSVVY